MLKFIYAGDTERQKEGQWHRWPFVYLHGMAERINMASFEEGGEAPDICLANESMDNYVPCIGNGLPVQSWDGSLSIPCLVNDSPAVCVLYQRPLVGFGGRIALVEDLVALQHVVVPGDWR